MIGAGRFFGKGRTGTAPNTMWLCPLADRINMLSPLHVVSNSSLVFIDRLIAANYCGNWTIHNNLWNASPGTDAPTASFGDFTAAPDGSVTAQKIVESAVNTKHYITAGYRSPLNDQTGGNVRFAAIFKKGERTRVVMEVAVAYDGGGNPATYGAKVVFDLAGGQIGVAPASFGARTYTPIQAQISSVGSGFYLCIFDVAAYAATADIGGSAHRRFAIYLDAGSGTDAENSTYLGDGSSGLYGWKTNALPPKAWGINAVSYFEDFDDDTRSNFDLAQTQAAGFDWYTVENWPGYTGLPNTPGTLIAVSGSVVTLTPNPDNGWTQFQSATYGGTPGTYVGFAHTIPCLIEARLSTPVSHNYAGNNSSFWSSNVETINVTGSINRPPGREIDYFEVLNNAGRPGSSVFNLTYPSAERKNQNPQSTMNGFPEWSALVEYGIAHRVWHSGVPYICLNSAITNDPPPSSNWAVITSVTDEDCAPVGAQTDAMHTYSCLMLPYTSGEFGCVMFFCDGRLSNGQGFALTYSPTDVHDEGVTGYSRQFHTSDGGHLTINLSAGINMPLQVDWVSLMQ